MVTGARHAHPLEDLGRRCVTRYEEFMTSSEEQSEEHRNSHSGVHLPCKQKATASAWRFPPSKTSRERRKNFLNSHSKTLKNGHSLSWTDYFRNPSARGEPELWLMRYLWVRGGLSWIWKERSQVTDRSSQAAKQAPFQPPLHLMALERISDSLPRKT